MFRYNLEITDSYEVMGDIVEKVINENKKNNGIKITHKNWEQISKTDSQYYNVIVESDSAVAGLFINQLKLDYPNGTILSTPIKPEV